MPNFKQYKETSLDEQAKKENVIHNEQMKKRSNTTAKMPMPPIKEKESKEATYLMLKNKDKLKKLANEAGVSMADLVDFWIENA